MKENIIYWDGAGYYYPAQVKDDNGNWFTLWSYRSDDGEPLTGMGTPQYFDKVPDGFIIR